MARDSRRPPLGGNLTPPAPLEDIPEQGWRATIDGNLLATFLTLKSFLPGMKERGRGTIITVASAAGRRPDARSPIAYHRRDPRCRRRRRDDLIRPIRQLSDSGSYLA